MMREAFFVALLCGLSALPVAGETARGQALEAWARIYEVVSHPRCANCHTGPSDRPMWSGPSYRETRPHGMNIRAGESRIGAETLPCRTCHITTETGGNAAAHMAPQVADAWRLAPVEAHWFGQTSAYICTRLRDPDLNGGRTAGEIADHLGHDVILHWAWAPGGGREPAPYDLERHIADIRIWGDAGQPCPE
ncbi:hypothetical protein [Roseobacter ponti]|uniref:Cytochrome c domain-containing protein n=1 Tax=Roseobacter ponti TaxID=1891787 RepID=A0A858SU04_9RHOB|nr:hypothetical protein [Roseobacter ponti]QJF50366.1 hypothetical protein G3256_03895 [Roseobacter ponti]